MPKYLEWWMQKRWYVLLYQDTDLINWNEGIPWYQADIREDQQL